MTGRKRARTSLCRTIKRSERVELLIDVGEELVEGRKVFQEQLQSSRTIRVTRMVVRGVVDPGRGRFWKSDDDSFANGWKRERTRREKREKVAGRRQFEMQIQGSTEVYIGTFSTGRG